MRKSKTSVKKVNRPALHTEVWEAPSDMIERCPECGHVWNDVGPVHYTDCRYFWLEEDRDEDASVLRDEWGSISHEAA
jgi:hypothetical protein